jgi:hypothetical protein
MINNYFENNQPEEKQKKPKKPTMKDIFIVPPKMNKLIQKKKKLIKSLTPQ